MTTRAALLGAIAITALVVGSGFSEDAAPNAPTNAAGVPWGMRLAEFQKARPNAQCQVTHARDYRRDPPGPSESGRSSTTWSTMLAHSDSEAWDLKPFFVEGPSGRKILFPSHNDTRAPLVHEIVEQLEVMCGKLMEAVF